MVSETATNSEADTTKMPKNDNIKICDGKSSGLNNVSVLQLKTCYFFNNQEIPNIKSIFMNLFYYCFKKKRCKFLNNE